MGDTKQKKLTPLDRGSPLHVNRVLVTLSSSVILLLFSWHNSSSSVCVLPKRGKFALRTNGI